MLLGNLLCECHNLLKKGLGTHILSYETLQWRMNVINAGWEDTVNAPALCHKLPLMQHTCMKCLTAHAVEKESCQRVLFHILTEEDTTSVAYE